MPLQTATDLAALMDSNDADLVTLADGSTLNGHLTQGYSESLDIPGRRPILVAITSQVSGVSIGDTVDIEDYLFTVQHIEQTDTLSRLFLEKRAA